MASERHNWSKLSRQQRGYDAAWDRLRAAVMKRDKFMCQVCWNAKPQRFTEANQVDHIIAKANGGTNDLSNLRAICHRCHFEKTLRDRGHEPKTRFGVDGNPIE